MKNNKWYAAVAFVTLFALAGTASAHDMDNGGEPAHHHHHMMGDNAKNCPAGMKGDFKKMHALHEKLHAVLAAKAFDKKAFLSLSAQMDKLRSQMARKHAEAFADRAAKMSPEEREKMMHKFHEHEEGNWQHHGIMWSHKAQSNNNQAHDWTPSDAR